MSHVSMAGYNTMNRILKLYKFAFGSFIKLFSINLKLKILKNPLEILLHFLVIQLLYLLPMIIL